MGVVADIMGLSTNVMTDREFLGLVRLYLGNDQMNVIYMFSVDTCKFIAENDWVADVMNEADIRLPAEKIILNKIYRHSHIGIARNYKSFLYVLRVKGLVKSIFVIGKNAKLTENLIKVFSAQNERVEVCGHYSAEEGESDESVINDINSKAPDIIVVALDTPDLQEWIERNKLKLNSRMCVCLCDISETVVKENVEPPGLIQKLALGRLYNFVIRRRYTENNKKERIFKALLAEYNDKNSG